MRIRQAQKLQEWPHHPKEQVDLLPSEFVVHDARDERTILPTSAYGTYEPGDVQVGG